MTTLKHEVEREAFEAWAPPRFNREWEEGYGYKSQTTRDAWASWLARASHEDKGWRWRLQTLECFAEGRLNHINRGLCPDHVAGHDSRDPECQICQALPAAPSSHDGEDQ